ncbi:BES1/BZR1 protein 4 [Sarracenia purpurea var. burkii]
MQGCKPAAERIDNIMGGSTSASPSPCSSYHPSPCASYNPSPASSSFPSPTRAQPGPSLIPWLKNLSSGSSSASSSFKLPHLYIHGGGSISAPVTPPLSSPTSQTPRIKTHWNLDSAAHRYSLLPSSTPLSPTRQILPDSEWFSGIRIPQVGPASPTFSLVSSNLFGFKDEVTTGGGSRMWTPGQSGTCSPAVAAGFDHTADVPMSEAMLDEFAFGSNATGLVKPWEGERIHEECGSDDLQLTLGSSKTRLVTLDI